MINLEITYKFNKVSYSGMDLYFGIKSYKNSITMFVYKLENDNFLNMVPENILVEIEFFIPVEYFDICATNVTNYEIQTYLHKFHKLSRHNLFKKHYLVNINIEENDSKIFKDFFIAKFESDDIKTLFSERYSGNKLFCNRIKFLDISTNTYIEYKQEYENKGFYKLI